MVDLDKKQVAKMIDHTNLKPTAVKHDIVVLCDQAIKHGFGAVCINPVYVSLARELLKDSEVDICTVIGFPLGANTSEVKAFEAKKGKSRDNTDVKAGNRQHVAHPRPVKSAFKGRGNFLAAATDQCG